MTSHKIFLFFAALFGLLAVIMGAIGAHGLEQSVSATDSIASGKNFLSSLCDQCDNMTAQSFERLNTGVKYQFYHVAALLGIGILLSLHRNHDSTLLKLSGFGFILGILLFSGGLYAFAVTGNSVFGKMTPFGGISLILGWFFLLIYALKK